MVKSILEELFYGNIAPNVKHFTRTSEFGKNQKIITESEEKLSKYFDSQPNAEEERLALKQLIDSQIELTAESDKESFIEGFKLAFLLTVEVMTADRESPFVHK